MEPPPKQGCELNAADRSTRDILSQWNPRRSRGASCTCYIVLKFRHVSVEPPPKQGCEKGIAGTYVGYEQSQWNPRRSRGARPKYGKSVEQVLCLSGTPAEAGVRDIGWGSIDLGPISLSGTPAEAGVRAHHLNPYSFPYVVSVEPPPKQGCEPDNFKMGARRERVSVEPPPKQGCEGDSSITLNNPDTGLSGTPAEAGVRGGSMHSHNSFLVPSQWNPRRSRGAR